MNTELITTKTRQMGAPMLPAPPLRGPAGNPEELKFSDAWRVLLKRRIVVIASVAILFALALAYSLTRTPRYDSIARIAISFDNAQVFGADNPFAALTGTDLQTKLETQVRILSSDALASTVIRQLHLESEPLFAESSKSQGPLDHRAQRSLLNLFRSGLKVTVLPKTELIEIRYRSRSPELSAKIVTTLVNAYVERNFKVKYESTMQVSDWLQKQLDEIKHNVEQTQEKLAEFERAHGVLFFSPTGAGDESKNSTIAKLDELNRHLMTAQSERIMKEAAWRMAEAGSPELMANAMPGSSIQMLRTQEAELRSQYAQASAKFGPAYPKLAQLKAQLEQVESGIQREIQNNSERLKNEFHTAQRTEQMLSAEVDKQKREAYKLNEGAVQYTIMRREFESNRALYDDLLKKLKEAGITAGLRSTNVTMVEPAEVAIDPSEPNLPRNLTLGLGAGLLCGIVGAFVLENLDSTLRNVEEIESYTGLPSLGLIPLIKSPKGYRRASRIEQISLSRNVDIVALHRPKSQISEAFRSLRSSVLLSSIDAPLKTMVVTSALPREGKSTTTINSAIVLAQKGARVLLIDADMRRPRLHNTFKISNAAGLSTVVSGTHTFEEAVVTCPELETLSVLPAGPSAPYPAELLASQRMVDLLAKWREQFDYVILDTPPVLTVTDAVILAAQADTTIVVMRWGQTGHQALRRSRDLLQRAQARIAGVVVNAVNFDSPEHYYYYGGRYGYYGYRYGSGYGYGSDYYDNDAAAHAGGNHNGSNGNFAAKN